MKELVNIYIGQAGVQQAHAAWELLAAEHGISLDATISNDCIPGEGIDRLFSISKEKTVRPLALLIDTENAVIDELRAGTYKLCFSENNFVTGFEDTSSLFPRGYFGEGRCLMKNILTNLQSILEKCDSVQCIAFWHSVGGGTGSGLHSLLVEELEIFSKLDKLELITYPSHTQPQEVVEPYNSILSQHYTMDAIDISFMFDNSSLYKIAKEKLYLNGTSYANINRIIAQMYNTITASTRYPGFISDLREILQNLIPYPRIHFPICSLSTLSTIDNTKYLKHSVESVTFDGLLYESNLVSCKLSEGFYIACCLLYRGTVDPSKACKVLQNLKCYKELKFVDWCPTGIKTVFCDRSACVIQKGNVSLSPISLGILSNNSAISNTIIMNTYRYQMLFCKRSFVHWFVGAGLEEDEFIDAMENVFCLISDYESLTKESLQSETTSSENENSKKDETGKNCVDKEQGENNGFLEKTEIRLNKNNLLFKKNSNSLPLQLRKETLDEMTYNINNIAEHHLENKPPILVR